MPPPPKGKPPTKGARQIMAENAATVIFYRNMTLTTGAFYNIFFFFFFYEHMCPLVMCMNILVTIIYIICYHLMRYISRPQYSLQTYHLLDPGHDLNMEGGFGEHLKDIMIVTSITHLMALFSNKFWLTLLVIPLRAIWLIWMTNLEPWFAQDNIQDIDVEENKPKKSEKMKWSS